MNYLVVSPSISPINPEYYQAVKDVDILVVDDSDGLVDRKPIMPLRNINYFLRDDVLRYIPKGSEALFPQHNPSCKDFGLYYAWKERYDAVILLDDDCDTSVNPDFLEQIPVGKEIVAHEASMPFGWWNPMIQLGKPQFFSRGFPYEYRVFPPEASATTRLVTPKFNEGLWWGTPDINGIDKVGFLPSDYETSDQYLVPDHVAIRWNSYVPISIMNVQLVREVIPAFYQPPDFGVAPGWKIRRHDDVWSGLVLQTLMHKRKDVFTVGNPFIYHRKRGDLLREAKSENCTNLIQPYLFHLIEEAADWVVAGGYGDMVCMLADTAIQLLNRRQVVVPGAFAPILVEYFTQVGAWAKLFN